VAAFRLADRNSGRRAHGPHEHTCASPPSSRTWTGNCAQALARPTPGEGKACERSTKVKGQASVCAARTRVSVPRVVVCSSVVTLRTGPPEGRRPVRRGLVRDGGGGGGVLMAPSPAVARVLRMLRRTPSMTDWRERRTEGRGSERSNVCSRQHAQPTQPAARLSAPPNGTRARRRRRRDPGARGVAGSRPLQAATLPHNRRSVCTMRRLTPLSGLAARTPAGQRAQRARSARAYVLDEVEESSGASSGEDDVSMSSDP